MKDLAIKRNLDENTRKQGIWGILNGKATTLSLHITNTEVIITDNYDYTKIYAIYSLEYYNAIQAEDTTFNELKWAAYAECEAKNNGKIEKFDRLIAAFIYPHQAEDFIKNCLPKENTNHFKIVFLQE